MRIQRKRKRRIAIPSVTQARPDVFGINVKLLANLSKTPRNSAHRDDPVRPFIPILLFPGGPHNVGWEIAKVVIDALNRPAVFTDANIGKKAIEHHPLWANGNTAPAIIVVVVPPWVSASCFHGFPDAMDARVAHTVREQRFVLSIQTPARSSAATPKAGQSNRFGPTTVAGANEAPNLISGWSDVGGGLRNYDKPSKPLADDV